MNENEQLVLVLQGLNNSLTHRRVYFVLALTSYAFTLFVNVTLILTVCLDRTLHQPMYVLVVNLCLTGICGASSFYLKLLVDLLADAPLISYAGCLVQMFVTYTYVFCQFTGLTAMACDRYLAICQPLRYWAMMTFWKVALMLLFTWCVSLLETAVGVILIARLQLCSNRMPGVFCTSWEVVKLACTDTSANSLYGILVMFLHLLQVAAILASYVPLIRAAVRSQADRRRFAQTCAPHLASLVVFSGSLLFDTLYSRFGGGSMAVLQNALAAEFLVVPPIVNPLIYGMNLKQIRYRIHFRFHFRPDKPQTEFLK